MAISSTTALALTAASTLLSTGAAVRQGNIDKEVGELQQRQADSRAATERRNVVRMDRLRRAQIINASANQGTQGSSSEVSALGGVASQTAASLSQSNQIQGLSTRISNAQQTGVNIGLAGNLFDTIGNTTSRFM